MRSHVQRFLMLLLSICALIAASGCASPEEVPIRDDRTLVEQTVREYNRLLIQGFADLDMVVLEPIATQEQAEREYIYMAALGEGRMRLDATLVSIEFGDIQSSSTTPTVETHEVWDYRRVNIDTGALMAEEKGVAYDLRYTLTLVSGRWIVAAVDPLDESSPSRDTTRLP